MGFWSNLLDRSPAGVTANANPDSSVGVPWNPGDSDGLSLVGFEPTFSRSLPTVMPSPWDGWPADWGVPNWDFGSRFNELIDIAWACLDLNSSVLSAMPVYRTRSGEILEPAVWMANPDPLIYTSWHEFAKQLFWDYQMGEAFVLPMLTPSSGLPAMFRVIPPYLIDVQLRGGTREYRLGGPGGIDVTDEILHIRYKSATDKARGVGPLESAGGRMLTAGILAKYVRDTVQVGGVITQTLETEQDLSPEDADDLLHQWVTTRAQHLGYPPVLDNNVKLIDHNAVSPKDMALIEIAQFTEARIAILLGVPPFLVGLPSGGDSMTYSNVSALFDYHHRASLRPKAVPVMAALSNWALPSGEEAELNHDEYTRPDFAARSAAWVALSDAGLITVDQFLSAERLVDNDPSVTGTVPSDYQTRIEALGSLIRSGFDPKAAAAALGLTGIEHSGLAPVTVQRPPSAAPLPVNPQMNGSPQEVPSGV